jgi:hypothetical protein
LTLTNIDSVQKINIEANATEVPATAVETSVTKTLIQESKNSPQSQSKQELNDKKEEYDSHQYGKPKIEQSVAMT